MAAHKTNFSLRKIIDQFLPPCTFRAGYSKGAENPFPPGLHHTEIEATEPNCLDALYLHLTADAGAEPMVSGIDLLRPGGIAFLSIPRFSYNKRRIEGISRGLGLAVLKTVRLRKFQKERRVLVVLRKSLFQKIENRSPLLSVLIPYDPDSDFESSLESWRTFLKKNGLYDRSECIVIDDGNIQTDQVHEIERSEAKEPILFLSHYRHCGLEATVMTGLRHASGKFIVLDHSKCKIPPAEIFPLLSKMLRGNRSGSERIAATIGVESSGGHLKHPGLLSKKRVLKYRTGTVSPESEFMILDGSAVREILDGPGSGSRRDLLIRMKKRGWIIDEEKIRRD